MPEKTLSICMIAKNEENNIERCFKSITHIADEIIVVDTGSTDKTIEICEKYGAKVILYEWKNDFSDARNKSLEYATKDWILFLDADEELPYEDGLAVKEIINKDDKFEGFYLRLVNIIDKVDIGDAIVFRLFKNDPDYKFKGKMHEQIIHSVQNKAGVNSVASTQIKIFHYGYDPSVADINKKAHRNIGLLLSYDEEDKDGYYYYALGNEYTRLGKEKEALDAFSTSLNMTDLKNNIPIYYPYLITSIIKLFFGYQKFKDALDYIKKFKKDCKDFKDLYFYECLANIECAKLSNAYKALNEYVNCKQLNYSYPTGTFDKQYDVNSLMEQLKNGSIHHEEKLLSGVILAKNNEPNLVDTIKSLSEIVCEVIVVTPDNSNLDRQKLENYGAKILDAISQDDNQCYNFAFKKCRGKFVIILKPLEICSFDSQKLIVDLLSKSPRDGYYLQLIDKENNNLEKSVRLLRNNKKISKFENFDKFVTENKVKDTSIVLHKFFDASN